LEPWYLDWDYGFSPSVYWENYL